MALQFSTTARNAMLDSITTTMSTSGLLRIYSGTKPATPGTALSGNTLLAELACSATFAGSASGGVLTLNSISDDASADNAGTATFFRFYKSDGTTCVIQGDVSTSGSDLNLVTTTFLATQPVRVTSFTITAPGA